jgi:hypothetical protein
MHEAAIDEYQSLSTEGRILRIVTLIAMIYKYRKKFFDPPNHQLYKYRKKVTMDFITQALTDDRLSVGMKSQLSLILDKLEVYFTSVESSGASRHMSDLLLDGLFNRLYNPVNNVNSVNIEFENNDVQSIMEEVD